MDASIAQNQVLDSQHAGCRRVAAVIPIHKPRLSAREAERVDLTLANCPEGTAFFVGPSDIASDGYRSRWPDVDFRTFDPANFKDVAAYNRWMLTPDLYRCFRDFEFILVCQTDALLVKPLPVHEPWSFDYLGAPWEPPWIVGWNPILRRLGTNGLSLPKRALNVGNGGLSLRRTSVFSENLRIPRFQELPNEDVVLSYFHRRLGIRLAEDSVAARFFMELGARSWSPGMPVPRVFGFHALNRHNPRLEDAILRHSSHHSSGQ